MDSIKLLNKIAIIGPYPPPPGGVTTHIKRLSKMLYNKGYYVDIINTNQECKKKNKYIIHLPRLRNLMSIPLKKYFILHLHYREVFSTLILIFRKIIQRKKLIITFHNERVISHLKRYNILFRFSLSFVDSIIVTRNDLKLKLIKQLYLNSKKISVIDAYLPPSSKLSNNYISHKIINFTNNRSPVLLGYAHRLQIHNGCDLYGIDIQIKMLSILKNIYKDVGLYLRIPNPDNILRMYVLKLINKYKVKDSVFLSFEFSELTELIPYFDLYIRPTNTDGDSVLIREVLSLGVPCIVSDAVPRPKECILFKNRNINDLIKKIEIVMNKKKLNITQYKSTNPEKIIGIYETLF